MSFDVLAPHYTWMERVLAGPHLQRSRVAWLDELAGCRNVLVAGVGHGHFLRAAARRCPHAHFTALDASPRMLQQAEHRAGHAGLRPERFTFLCAALPDWAPPAGAFDGIVTHFFLDCFPPEELEAVIAVLASAATANATWLVSDFAVPARGAARQRARAVHALMYGFFRRVTRLRARRLTEPDPWLRAHGFALVGRRTAEWGLLRADAWRRRAAA